MHVHHFVGSKVEIETVVYDMVSHVPQINNKRVIDKK